MSVCTFLGHSDCYGLEEKMLLDAIEERIANGVDTFYVGNQGHFDSVVVGCLKKLQKIHTNLLQYFRKNIVLFGRLWYTIFYRVLSIDA